MDLAKRDQRPRLNFCCGTRSREKEFAVRFHAFALIVFGEAQIERAATINGASSTRPDAESVHKPGNSLQDRSAQNALGGRFARTTRLSFNWSCHGLILNPSESCRRAYIPAHRIVRGRSPDYVYIDSPQEQAQKAKIAQRRRSCRGTGALPRVAVVCRNLNAGHHLLDID